MINREKNNIRFWKFVCSNELTDNIFKRVRPWHQKIKASNLERYVFEDAIKFENREWRLPFYEEIVELSQNPHRFYGNGILFNNGLFLPYNSNSEESEGLLLGDYNKLRCNQCIFWIGDLSNTKKYNETSVKFCMTFNTRMCEYIVWSQDKFMVKTNITANQRWETAGILLVNNLL